MKGTSSLKMEPHLITKISNITMTALKAPYLIFYILYNDVDEPTTAQNIVLAFQQAVLKVTGNEAAGTLKTVPFLKQHCFVLYLWHRKIFKSNCFQVRNSDYLQIHLHLWCCNF